MNRTIKPLELKPLVENRSVVVLDVRRKSDYDSDKARLPGAQWRDPEKIAEWSAFAPEGQRRRHLLRPRRFRQQFGGRLSAGERRPRTLHRRRDRGVEERGRGDGAKVRAPSP